MTTKLLDGNPVDVWVCLECDAEIHVGPGWYRTHGFPECTNCNAEMEYSYTKKQDGTISS